MKFEELKKGRLYGDKVGNMYMFDGYNSPSEAEMVVMEFDKEDDCYYSTEDIVLMDRLDVLYLE